MNFRDCPLTLLTVVIYCRQWRTYEGRIIMKIKKLETGKTYTAGNGQTVKIKRRTAKMCEVVAYHRNGMIDIDGTGMHKVQLSLTNDQNYDRIELVNPWGRFNYGVHA